MVTVAIVFDHRGRARKNGEGPLELRITENRKPVYVATGLRVRRSQWLADSVVDHPSASEYNRRLRLLVQKVNRMVNDRIEHGQAVDAARIRRDLYAAESHATLLDWFRAETDRLDVKAGTRKHYVTLCKRLEEWGGMQAWQDVDVDALLRFDGWLRNLPGRSATLTEAGRHVYHKCLRYMLNRAVMLDLIPSNPYGRLRGRFGRGERENMEFLSDEEVEAVRKVELRKGSLPDKARDLFVFQLYTGLSYADTQTFDFSRYKEVDGTWRIVGNRVKTGEPFVNQLLPPAVEVLERHGMETPKLSNQVYNRELKEIGRKAGLACRLHSHLARHTFATWMLRNGVKVENLSKMLGHTNISRTMRYAKVVAESVHRDFEMVADKMKKADATS